MFQVNVRNYGWYCSRCREHRNIENLYVAAAKYSNWLGIVCKECNTELVDCKVAKRYYKLGNICDDCADRFNCFSDSEAHTALPLVKVLAHEVHPHIPMDGGTNYGVKSYTGKVYDKLETDKFCCCTERDDCNHSYMRANYTGEKYYRCREMKYNSKEKKWYCRYGKNLRGEA